MTPQKPKTRKENIDAALGSQSHNLPEWLEELTESIVEASASSDVPAIISLHPELSGKVVSGKH